MREILHLYPSHTTRLSKTLKPSSKYSNAPYAKIFNIISIENIQLKTRLLISRTWTLYIFINNNFPKTLNFLYTFVSVSGWSWCSKERLNVFKRMQTLIPCIKTSCSIIRLRFSLTAEKVSLVCSVPSYMNLKTEHRMICKVLIFDL